MTIEAQDIIDFSTPEFDTWTEEQVQVFMDEAALEMNPVAWGSRYDTGLKYLTLHMMEMFARAQLNATTPGTGGQIDPGSVKWLQTDNMQVGYSSLPGASSLTLSSGDSWLSQTSYGSFYLFHKNKIQRPSGRPLSRC